MSDFVIKGTSIGWTWERLEEDNTVLGCFVIHTMMSWKLYMDNQMQTLTDEEKREYGKVIQSLSGIQNDLHNLSVVIDMLNEIVTSIQSRSPHSSKLMLQISVLLETYFTNLRSIFDFCSTFVRIAVSNKLLKSMPSSDSYNALLKFVKKETVVGAVPPLIIESMMRNEHVFESVKKVRDLIIHKGEDTIVDRNSDKTICFTLYKHKDGDVINMATDLLETNQPEYPVMKYLSELTRQVLNFLDLFGRALFHCFEEVKGFPLPLWLTALAGHCMPAFIKFLNNDHA
jgi:hypothetical protein